MALIMYFSTTWCAPCKMFKPVVQGVAAETNTNISYVDAEQSKELATQYGIQSVPTIVVSDNGNVLYKHAGIMSKQQVRDLFNRFK